MACLYDLCRRGIMRWVVLIFLLLRVIIRNNDFQRPHPLDNAMGTPSNAPAIITGGKSIQAGRLWLAKTGGLGRGGEGLTKTSRDSAKEKERERRHTHTKTRFSQCQEQKRIIMARCSHGNLSRRRDVMSHNEGRPEWKL